MKLFYQMFELTRSRDGSTGTATFRFKTSTYFRLKIQRKEGEITGMYSN